ncbi:hypothetical protein [Rudaeicoccus suwonensis]|uniref:HicA-like toxin of HicAB toxin-antitoxin system n=1 Tax=Rudaeicoccus suwonensis TaxID=657409 RepID=A0A561DVM3_9MICO|nr:hypothetical protein [Rudaeicoccus suwonensis]TWE07390.1 hypothetical protein BKA23_3403 [Rudaeicoccus suwonensis]
MSKKEIRELITDLHGQGFAVRRTRRGHFQVTKNGQVVAVIAGTPSDYRSSRNGLAALRRAGYCHTKFA